jgi:hypothetical protein
MDILPIFSGIGIGAVITTVVQAWITNRNEISKRNFQERKECYVGLLEAYHRAAVEDSDAAAKNFGYWQMRCELVAPADVREAIQEIVNTNDTPSARNVADENLKRVLRKDMKVAQ